MSLMVVFFVVIYGLLLGSFFNVLICRLPANKSILHPPSHCPVCNSPVKPWQNIPLVSYLFLRGKCHTCKHPISIMYPLVEATSAVAAAGIWMLVSAKGYPDSLPGSISLIASGVFLLLIIPITIIDFKHYIIPDSLTLPLLGAGILLSFLPGALSPQQALLGILAGGGTLYVIGWVGGAIMKKEAMGGGDIKLMAAAGAFFGPQCSLLSIVFGATLGAIYGIAIMATKRLSGTHQIPFGPFLGAGIWIAVFAGQYILTAYLHLIGLSIK